MHLLSPMLAVCLPCGRLFACLPCSSTWWHGLTCSRAVCQHSHVATLPCVVCIPPRPRASRHTVAQACLYALLCPHAVLGGTATPICIPVISQAWLCLFAHLLCPSEAVWLHTCCVAEPLHTVPGFQFECVMCASLAMWQLTYPVHTHCQVLPCGDVALPCCTAAIFHTIT